MARKLRIHSPAIHYFDMVRRCQSIREASRRLNVASSAVNRQILKLEDEVGTPLFERLPGGLRLTAAGEIFARHVIVVLQDTERVRPNWTRYRGLRTGHVEIATVSGVTTDLLPGVLEQLRERYPRVTVGVTSLGSQAIPDAVTSGQADIGLAFALPRTADLQQLGVGHFRLGAIVAPGHPLAERRDVSFATCAEYPLIPPRATFPSITCWRLLASHSPAAQGAAGNQFGGAGPADGQARRRRRLPDTHRHRGRAGQRHLARSAERRRLGVQRPGVYVRSSRYLPVAVDAFVRALSEEIAIREAAQGTSSRTTPQQR